MLPAQAVACPMCFASSSKGVLQQFYATAAGLTVLPFVLVVGVALYIRHLRRRGPSPPGPRLAQGDAPDDPAETSSLPYIRQL